MIGHLWFETLKVLSTDQHLEFLNSYANGLNEQYLRALLPDDEFRRIWLQILQIITNDMKRNNRKTRDVGWFQSVTRALTVQLYSYVEDSKLTNNAFDCTEICEFLRGSERNKSNSNVPGCFKLLNEFLQLTNSNKTKDILKALR